MGISDGVSATDYITNKEKRTSAIVTIGAIGLGVFFLGPVVLPSILGTLGMLNAIVGSTLALVIKLGLAAGLGFVALQPRTWTLAWHVNNMVSRKLGRFIFKMDPTGRLEAFAHEYLAGRRAKVIAAITKVTAVHKDVERQLAERRKQVAQAEERAKSLLRMSFDPVTQKWSNRDHAEEFRRVSFPLKMWHETVTSLERNEQRLALYLAQLDKWRQGFDFYIEATRLTVDELKARFEASQGMAEAVGAISDSMGEGGDMKQFFDQNVAFLNEEISKFDAQVEVAMTVLPELNKGFDVNNDVAEDELMQRLLEMDQRADVALEGARAALQLPSGTPEEQATTPRQMGQLAQARQRSLLSR